jgi:hypothetical protein
MRRRGVERLSRPEKRLEQCVADLFELASRPDLRLPGAASCDLLEVSEFDFECDGAPTNTGALAVPPDLVDDLSEGIPPGFVGDEIDGKRVLGSGGFPYPIGANGPLVDPARNPVLV